MDMMIDKWKGMLDEERALRKSRENTDRKSKSRDKKESTVLVASEDNKGNKVFKEDIVTKTKTRSSRENLIVRDFEQDQLMSNTIQGYSYKTPAAKSQKLAFSQQQTPLIRKTPTIQTVPVSNSKISSNAIIDKISYMVLEATKRQTSDSEKLSIIKNIMLDLYLPTLQIIEELENKLRSSLQPSVGTVSARAPSGAQTPTKDRGEFEKSKRMVVALEGRVQELTTANCLNETKLSDLMKELEKTKERLRAAEANAKIDQCGGLRLSQLAVN